MNELRRELMQHVPASSAEWVERLVTTADRETLVGFLRWHSPDSIRALFEWTPPWQPPHWGTFVRHGIGDWVPVHARVHCYLEPNEFRALRTVALDLASGTDLRGRAFALLLALRERVRWSAAWGAATPQEILRRGEGGSLHMAQTYIALLRAMWIPARLMEEVAFAPQEWIRECQAVWRGTPEPARNWLGRRILYHPLCEFHTAGRWVPVDPQRGWFGDRELEQHLRVPHLLKLDLWTREALGREMDRARRYLTDPLRLHDPGHPVLRTLAEVRAIRRRSPFDAPLALEEESKLLDGLEERVRTLWRERARLRAVVVGDRPLPTNLWSHLSAASPAPIFAGDEASPPVPGELRVLVGSAVRLALRVDYQKAMHEGASVVALLEPWGEGEVAGALLVASLGGRLKPPSPGGPDDTVIGHGGIGSALPAPVGLDLRLAPRLRGLPKSDDRLSICNPMLDLVAWSGHIRRGRLTIFPASLLASADPYRTDLLAGHHRRVVNALLSLGRGHGPRVR